MESKRVLKIVATAALLSAAFALHAAGKTSDIIKYRQNVMKTNGANAGAAAAILQGKVEFKDRLLDHAKVLEASTKNLPELFPKGSGEGDTRALAKIWKEWSEFEDYAKKAHAKAQAFEHAVASNDKAAMNSAFKELGESCKACHKDFRKEKK